MALAATKEQPTAGQLPVKLGGSRAYEAGKRAMDIVISAAILLGLSPIWLAIAALIRLTSAGGSLYAGRVVGRHGREFTYYKFRTMRSGVDNQTHRTWLEEFVKSDQPYTVVDDNKGSRAVYKVIDDPRVTPVGRWLRRTSLDEVPQLINVLRGEMSLVGPRPPVPYEYALYDDWAKQRLRVTPGITGLYQVTERSAVGFRRMVEIDLDYMRRRSLLLDVSIIVRTPFAMLSGKGAA